MGNSGFNWIFGRIIPFGIVLLLFPTLALAGDYCDFVSPENRDSCSSIMAYPWPSFIENMIIDAIFQNAHVANHDAIWTYNSNLNFNYNREDSGVIRNAYFKLISISPSVLINDRLFISDSGRVLEKHDYNIDLPSGTERYDCRTEYELTSNQWILRLYLDNIYFSSINFFNLNFEHEQPVNLRMEYNIDVSYNVEHYEEVEYCADWDRICDENGCERYCDDWDYECEYDYSETRYDSLSLRDSKQVYFFKTKPSYYFKIIDGYYETLNGKAIADNFSSFEVIFPESFFRQANYFYPLVFDDEDILTLKVNENKDFTFSNLIINPLVEGTKFIFNFYVKENNSCQITLRDHFFEKTEDCNLNFEELKIETNKVSYNEGEIIEITIFPENTLVNISYNNTTLEGMNNLEFTASKNDNEVTARLEDAEFTKKIYIENETPFNTLATLAIFGFLIYLTFKIGKKFSKDGIYG